MGVRARDFIEGLLGQGRHTFVREEAERALGTSRAATYQALRRLQQDGWLAMPRRGFYLVVDPQYRAFGALPAVAWIDDLMRFHEVPYYVGLLSAAALHGAAHQQPQEFQVVAGAILRPLSVGRVRIRFFFRRAMELAVTEKLKTSSGYIPVSTPEMTAYDLVRYRKGVGSMDHAATVLSELAERMDPKRLLEIAAKGEELPVIQRLGYLLELVGAGRLADVLSGYLEAQHPKLALLEPRSKEAVFQRAHRWRLLVNSTIELEA